MEALGWILSAGSSVREETQLKDEVDRLRSTLPKARLFISRGEWGSFKNKELKELLSQLKHSTYDAEDLLRELDDQELRQKIEDADRTRAGQVLSSSLNLARNFIHGSKTRVKVAQNKLDNAVAAIEGVLNLLGLNVESVQFMPETSSIVSAPQVFGRDNERDALMEMLGVPMGRVEIDQVIEQLGVPLNRGDGSRSAWSKRPEAASSSAMEYTSRAKRLKNETETSCIGDVSVLPIYGIGGVGKTTLAQLIFNDPRVKLNFKKQIWVCVSDLFDKRRITKEIVESISGNYSQSCSLNALQVQLKELLTGEECPTAPTVSKKKEKKACPKFLLVLDDIWPNANDEWEEFYAPLRTVTEGSMILVTTRCPAVANLVATKNCEPVELKGLPDGIFWEFFRKCAFGKNSPEEYPRLQDIGRSISSRLCGSPLAAKTLGRLLNMELTDRHWRTVQNSELWELPHRDNEILPALQLSYLYLPQELKRCFAFCSMFPKDYSFKRHDIVNIWVAEGFIAAMGSMRLEDLGNIYLDDLRRRFLFQSDPQFHGQNRYVMHDLIHDMAQSISVDECFLMQDLSYQNQRRTVHTHIRHMSVEVSGDPLSMIRDFQHLNKLRSLRFGTKLDVEINWFHQLSNILFLSLRGCKLIKLPESIGELSSLRYLDISGSCVQELPEKFWRLYSLQVLDASNSSLECIHQDVTKLINLRRLAAPVQVHRDLSRVSRLGNLSSLQTLEDFIVGRDDGRRIIELKGMNQLSGTLSVLCLNNVQSTKEAAEARLCDKQYIKELCLSWGWEAMTMSTMGQWRVSYNRVVEGLRPHPGIEGLTIRLFGGGWFSPSWFKKEDLPKLRSLKFYECFSLKCLSIPCIASLEELDLNEVFIESLITRDDDIRASSTSASRWQTPSSNSIVSSAFTSLTTLRLFRCCKLTNLDQFLSPENLPSIKLISLHNCSNLVSIPVHSFVGLVYLQELIIYGCDKLACTQEMVLPSSLRILRMHGCGELDRSFPACLENVTSLTMLHLVDCHNIRFLPLSSIAAIKCLVLRRCTELSSLGVSHTQSLSSIQHVELHNCPKLTQVEQHLRRKDVCSVCNMYREYTWS